MGLGILGRSAVIYAIGNMGMRAASLALIPLYAHLLVKAEFGLLFTVLFTSRIMLVLMNVGSRDSLARFAADAQSFGGMGTLLGSSLVVSIIGGSVVTGAALVMFYGHAEILAAAGDMTGLGQAADYIVYAAWIAVAQALTGQMMNYFRATNSAGRFMAVGVSVAVLLVVTNLIFLFWMRLGILGALLAQIISYGVVFVAVSLVVIPRTGLRVSLRVIRRMVSFGAPLVIAESSWFLMTGATVYFIGYHAGLESVATYTLGYKLAFILSIVLVLPIHLALPPFVYSLLDSPHVGTSVARALTYYVMAFALCSMGLLSVSRIAVGAMAPEAYNSAGLILVFILPAVGFYGLDSFGKTLLHVEKRSGTTGLIALAAGLASVALNLLLVRRFGVAGAIVAMNISTGLAALGSLYAGLSYFPLRLELGRVACACVVWLGAAATFVALRSSSSGVFYLVMSLVSLLALTIFAAILTPSERRSLLAMAARLLPRTKPALSAVESESHVD